MAGIYLHIPFCDTKCIYCDFYSITEHSQKSVFINSLIREINSFSELLSNRKFDTIYFGGGTPSLLNYEDFIVILETLYKYYDITKDAEITIEANPGTLNKSKLFQLKNLPINRISFGVQSFLDSELKFLSRIHNSNDAAECIKASQDAGYNNINIDLIFGLPMQTLENWIFNLNKAVKLNVQHISAYSLIYEKGTILNSLKTRGDIIPIDTEIESEMYEYTMDFLSRNGYNHYEVSNYAIPGFECKHNLKYWNLDEYIGFGPSAASYINNTRRTNAKNLTRYIELIRNLNKAYTSEEIINEQTSVKEHIMLGLRSKGIEYDKFKLKHNKDFEKEYEQVIEKLIENKLAKNDGKKFFLTRKGYMLCDEIITNYFL